MCKHKMDATPSFGATMIPEVSSNPQLTLTVKVDFIGIFKENMYNSYRENIDFI